MSCRPDDLDAVVQRQIAACGSIGTYLEARDLMVDTHMEQILVGTAARAKETFRSMCALAGEHQTVQAAMLCRSIFEDMVVAHWLVLHEDDPEFLTRRYIDHLDAIRLNEARTTERHGYSAPDVSDLAGREEELIRDFGASAQRQWWAVRRDGRPINMPAVIDVLEESDRFDSRLKGENRSCARCSRKRRSGTTSYSTTPLRACRCASTARTRCDQSRLRRHRFLGS
jgi:Family of unknown function (DUF5677)